MNSNRIAIMIYGEPGSSRNALTEEKYRDLATSFLSQGIEASSVLYNDEFAGELTNELLKYEAVLVWVNPIEQRKDRTKLDALLIDIANKGCFVSTHPEVILKMGTKDVLYKTREMEWGGDIKLYTSYEDFVKRFPQSLDSSGIRVLKQHRGNGGNGVFKVSKGLSSADIKLIHATESNKQISLTVKEFFDEFKSFFVNEGLLIDQEWNRNTINGMVRCYLTGTRVAGFGYQEINALYELNDSVTSTHFAPSKRYYFTENCGIFSDLKQKMENAWVPQLQKSLSIEDRMMPVIWDADFFINNPTSENARGKYSLCEINVSCVSPFPPSAIKFMVEEVVLRITK